MSLLRRRRIGSTESPLIWRGKVTKSGRVTYRLAPWTPPTSGKGFTGLPWRTPNQRDHKGSYTDLEAFNRRVEARRQINLNDEMSLTASVSPWVTPSSRDWKDTPGMTAERADGRSRLDQLPRQMAATWATPTVHGNFSAANGAKGCSQGAGDGVCTQMVATRPTVCTVEPVKSKAHEEKVSRPRALRGGGNGMNLATALDRTAHSGPITNGSSATTAKRGVPNPGFAMWLMSFPEEWIVSALIALLRQKKSRSSRK
jgi:hypothetical protein